MLMANLGMLIVQVPERELYTDWEEWREEKGECIKHGPDMKHWSELYTTCVHKVR